MWWISLPSFVWRETEAQNNDGADSELPSWVLGRHSPMLAGLHLAECEDYSAIIKASLEENSGGIQWVLFSPCWPEDVPRLKVLWIMKKQTSRELSWEWEVFHPHTHFEFVRERLLEWDFLVFLASWDKEHRLAPLNSWQQRDLRQNSLLGVTETHQQTILQPRSPRLVPDGDHILICKKKNLSS